MIQVCKLLYHDRIKSNWFNIINYTKKSFHFKSCEFKDFKTTNNIASSKKKTLEGGVIIQDLKVGIGAMAKNGKQVSVYYTGYLKGSNKIFDSITQSNGFQFKLGRGEVIKGWDVGVVGMKVGGKRIITCPPDSAYGSKGSPPNIPPNSTLIFDIEMIGIK
uniref:peptidylprolyl isomerase n=1 Tax=Clastoptera arizonana TaxID=38151 RepID=A0A1B6C3V3_9HEMI